MLTNIFSLFQSTFSIHADAEIDPAAGLKQRLASASALTTQALAANDHLRGFLKAVFRLREEGRVPDGEWLDIAHFLMRARKDAPRSVAHLVAQWPQALESWAVVRDLLRTPRASGEPACKTIAKLRALLEHLKQHAQKQSWLSHGFDVEFQKMIDDPAIDAPQRLEVLQIAAQNIGPMSAEQLRECMRSTARVMDLLSQDVYPCIRDVLSRVFNEASWQLDLFSAPVPSPEDEPLLDSMRVAARS